MNETSQVQILDEVINGSLHANAREKRHESIFLPLWAMVGLRFSTLVKVSGLYIYPTPPDKQNVAQDQFLRGGLIQDFPSWPVGIPRLKTSVCRSIYP